MKLLRLILQGFKSFADKTTIEFAEGMTVIVGPNGCGKSNISDAVRWVLGEQNIRNLRGQKTEDIIFSGSEERAPKNAAEVTLVLDNSDRELPLDTAEVAITRRVLRNGESEFKINKRSCRLKDIQELLATTGLGKGTMAIIGQNRVDQVLTAQPEERRLIFEEVAGISLYRMRKNEGLRKLEKTAENMERVRDLMALLDEQLVPLKEGAEKARIYKSLVKDKKAVEATMSLLKMTSIGRMLARYENEYNALADENLKWETRLSQVSAEKAELEEKIAAHQENLRKTGEESAASQQLMESLRGDYRVKEEALHHGEEETIRLMEEEKDQTEAEKELAEEIQEMGKELVAAEKIWKEKKILLEKERATKEKIAAELEQAEAEYREKLEINRKKQAEKERLTQEISHGETEKLRLFAEKEKYTATEKEAAEVRLDLEKQHKALADRESDIRQRMENLESNGKKDGVSLKEAMDKQYRLLNRQNDLQSQSVQIRSRKEYLERAEKEYTNFSRTTKTIMDSRSLWGEHILGVVGELLHVPPKYTKAAEVALGNSVSYIVTDTSKAAGDIISWLKENNLGRTTFYPLESMKTGRNDKNERQAIHEKGICGIASDLFQYEETYRELMVSVLGRTLIAEDLEAAREVSRKYNYRLRLVTLDGQVVNPGGSLTGGSMKKRENTFFGRKQEIRELLKQEADNEKELSLCRTEKIKHDDFCAQLSEKVTREREEWQALKVQAAEVSGKKEGVSRAIETQRLTEVRSRKEIEAVEENLALLLQNIKNSQEKLSEFREIPDMEEDEKSRRLRELLAEGENRLVRLHIESTKAEEAVSFGKRAEKEREEAKKEQEKDREELIRKIEENKKLKETLTLEIQELAERFNEAEKNWDDAKKKQEDVQNASDEFALQRKINDDAWREAQEKSAAVSKDMADRKARIDNFKTQETEELEALKAQNLTPETAEALRLSGSMADMKEKQSGLETRIAGLGNVNPNGEEEYELQLRRRKFYETQIEDLKKARAGLETVIRDIDTTMSARFTEAFKKINVEFGRIMQIMFSGGKARLELTDEAHPLEGDVEMYLQLPGKKRQPLTLMSGGERALTVIALLISFMAYRPAPFCFVDEIDAALDDANVSRYSKMIADYKQRTQFIVISHRKRTMEFADTLQGVTMGEKGVSSLVTVRVGDYIKEEDNGIS